MVYKKNGQKQLINNKYELNSKIHHKTAIEHINCQITITNQKHIRENKQNMSQSHLLLRIPLTNHKKKQRNVLSHVTTHNLNLYLGPVQIYIAKTRPQKYSRLRAKINRCRHWRFSAQKQLTCSCGEGNKKKLTGRDRRLLFLEYIR